MRQLYRASQLAVLLLQHKVTARRDPFDSTPILLGHMDVFRGIRRYLHRHVVDGFRFVVEPEWGEWWRNHPDWADTYYPR